MILNVPNPQLIRANREDLPTTGEFTYLGNTVRHDGRANKDIKNRLVKAINVVRMLNYVWRSQQQSTKTRLKLYHSCVLSTLIYGSECWRMSEGDLADCQSFTVFLNFVWDIWSSYSRGCHWKKLIIFLLSKVKVKMASILSFRKLFQWYWRVCRVMKLVSKPLSGRVFPNKTLLLFVEFICRSCFGECCLQDSISVYST